MPCWIQAIADALRNARSERAVYYGQANSGSNGYGFYWTCSLSVCDVERDGYGLADTEDLVVARAMTHAAEHAFRDGRSWPVVLYTERE